MRRVPDRGGDLLVLDHGVLALAQGSVPLMQRLLDHELRLDAVDGERALLLVGDRAHLLDGSRALRLEHTLLLDGERTVLLFVASAVSYLTATVGPGCRATTRC